MHNSRGANDYEGRTIILLNQKNRNNELTASSKLTKMNVLFKHFYGKQCIQIYGNGLLRFNHKHKCINVNLHLICPTFEYLEKLREFEWCYILALLGKTCSSLNRSIPF
jgi:hypothetical protein